MVAPPRFPGTPSIVDGSEAVAYVETRLASAACAYPITPSTTMSALYQAAVADGCADLWGMPLRFLELESEHSAASAAEGYALAGGRVTTFTAGQGLILMKEVLHVISGKRLPVVFHVGARALTSQALNIHAGHDDIMGVADTGWGILFARNAQEAADLAAIARRTAEATETPFFVAQDGFLTTHTLEDLRLPEDELLREFVGPPRLADRTDPLSPVMTGTVQNQDAYMGGRIAQRAFYDRLPAALEDAMAKWTALTGRPYRLIDAFRCEGARTIVVGMGTLADTAQVVVDALRSKGRAAGCVSVTAFRPFPADELRAALAGTSNVVVLERTDDPAAGDGPLTRQVKAALADSAAAGQRIPRVRSVAAGLGSRDVSPGDIAGAMEWADRADASGFGVLGIRHPLGIPSVPFDWRPQGAYALRGHSLGGLGSVATNKLLASLVGEVFGKHVQAYPRYGSEKKGMPTAFFLLIADEPIRVHAELERVDFLALHELRELLRPGALRTLVDGGVLFLPGVGIELPEATRAEAVHRHIRVAVLDTARIAREHAPRRELITRMQGMGLAGAFLRLTPFARTSGLGRDQLLSLTEAPLAKAFGKRGTAVLRANLDVIARGYDEVVELSLSPARDAVYA